MASKWNNLFVMLRGGSRGGNESFEPAQVEKFAIAHIATEQTQTKLWQNWFTVRAKR